MKRLWQRPLARELMLVLALKLVLIVGIKLVFFSDAVKPGSEDVARAVLSSPPAAFPIPHRSPD